MQDPQRSGISQTTSAVNALLAAWLIVSPWLLGIPSGTLAKPPIDFALNIVVIGSLVLAASPELLGKLHAEYSQLVENAERKLRKVAVNGEELMPR